MFIDKLIKIQGEITKIEKKNNKNIGSVEIMIVTKNQSNKVISILVENGYSYFGENRVTELEEKRSMFPNSRFAYIAPIQSRKLSVVMNFSEEIHSISRKKEIEMMSDYSWSGEYYLQVNIDKDKNKSGIDVEDVFEFIDYAYQEYKLPKGLMCMRSLDKKLTSEGSFSLMNDINTKVIEKYKGYQGKLSMGMSNDYKEAIIYGATVVRIGSEIFGK